MRLPIIKSVALAGVALVALATAASAQRGGGRRGGGGGDRQRTDSAFAEPPRPVPGVAALVLDHPADFALADSQRTVLQSIRHAQDSANAPWLQKLEALRPTGRPANGPDDLSQEQRDEIATRRAAIADATEGMRETNAEARQRVMALLTPDQQKKAAQLEEQARKSARDASDRDRNAGSQGAGGGGRRGGGGGGMGGMGGMGGGGQPPED